MTAGGSSVFLGRQWYGRTMSGEAKVGLLQLIATLFINLHSRSLVAMAMSQVLHSTILAASQVITVSRI